MSIAVIILNWNRASDTLESLASVYASRDVHFTTYLVDNGSTDGSLEEIRAAYPQATYIENRENLGFAEGNNRAIRLALKEGVDFLFLLNNDAIIRSDTLKILVESAQEHPEAGVFGPTIYFYDDPTRIWYAGAGWDPARASFFHVNQKRELEPTGYICGCALFARAELFREVGEFDPRFFLLWEEVDWCWRVRKKGYSCLYVPQAKAWHKISSSFVGGKRAPMWLYFYWRNRLLWMEKNLSKREFFKSLFKIVRPEAQHLVKQSIKKTDESVLARACLFGIRDYLFRRFGPAPKNFFLPLSEK